MVNAINKLQDWYSERCDGNWEHAHGISIETLDNPGWCVRIDLKDTEWADVLFEEINLQKAPSDWVRCVKEGCQFKGDGDPSKLEFILDRFLTYVKAVQTTKG